MPLVVTNAVLIRLIWTRGGVQHAINVYGATGLGPTSVNQALANTIGANVKSLATSSGLLPILGSAMALDKVGVRSIGAANQPEFLDSGAAAPGTFAGNLLPPQICFCITLRTALAGQEYRGRSYLGGWTVTHTDALGNATAGLQTAAVAFVDGLRTGQFGAALTLAIVSRKLLVATPVTLVLSRNLQFETQRRRAIPGV